MSLQRLARVGCVVVCSAATMQSLSLWAGGVSVALSTGNVYPMVPASGGGATEETALTPVGEYANAAVARERVFEYCAGRGGTPLVLLRLNYAIDLRYGVLHDLAMRLVRGEPIELANGWFNCIWQGGDK